MSYLYQNASKVDVLEVQYSALQLESETLYQQWKAESAVWQRVNLENARKAVNRRMNNIRFAIKALEA